MDIAKAAKNFLKRISEADQEAADMRAKAAELEKERALSVSTGVGSLEPGRTSGQRKSKVEAEAIKREGLQERAEALLHKARQMQQERGYVVAFLEELKYSSEFHHVGRVLECRYLQGWGIKATSSALHWKEAEIKRMEKRGLMCIGAVFLGLVEPGAHYDHDGLFVMGAEEEEKLLRKWH